MRASTTNQAGRLAGMSRAYMQLNFFISKYLPGGRSPVRFFGGAVYESRSADRAGVIHDHGLFIVICNVISVAIIDQSHHPLLLSHWCYPSPTRIGPWDTGLVVRPLAGGLGRSRDFSALYISPTASAGRDWYWLCSRAARPWELVFDTLMHRKQEMMDNDSSLGDFLTLFFSYHTGCYGRSSSCSASKIG